jgi:hypothetical protein
LHVWKDTPSSVDVTYPDTLIVGFSQPHITVHHSGTGLPVANAEICISGNDVYAVGYTLENGSIYINLNTVAEGELNILVRGGNVIPYEGTIQIVEGLENVAPASDPIVTDLDGNNDGLINPNENCNITFTLKNWGTQTSNNVYATLSVLDSNSYVQIITTDSISFGTLAPDQSVTGSPFQFFIEPDCPVGYTIPFQLQVSSTTTYWEYLHNEIVHGCQLEFNEYLIDDEGNVLNNNRMDPGETVKVILQIVNTGDDIAPDSKGILRSEDQYITIIDSVGTFGSILPDSSGNNVADYFEVEISQNCPAQYYAGYSVVLYTQNGLYNYSITDTFSIPVAMPSSSDPTGPDEYGYYAYTSDDIFWQQSPEYNWIEIEGIGTEIARPPGVSDYTQTVTLPFTFKYYGINYAHVRISTDGWIAPGTGTLTSPNNWILPVQDGVNNMVAIFWDDLFSYGPLETGKIFYYNDIDNHRFIIEWFEVGHYDDYTNRETFEVILLDPAYYSTSTGDGEIICQYKEVQEAGSCTVGLENNTEEIALRYVFNESYAITANELVDNFAIKFTTNSPLIVSVEDGNKQKTLQPTAYSLEQNYPNPFNPETIISYSLPEAGNVSLRIYRINGQLVKTLQDTDQLAGRYERIWDGRNESGNKVSSGVYFYRLQSNSFSQVKKMILLK